MRAEQEYFFCYNARMMAHLKRHGFSYICSALHEKSGNKFWLFARNNMLQATIDSFEK